MSCENFIRTTRITVKKKDGMPVRLSYHWQTEGHKHPPPEEQRNLPFEMADGCGKSAGKGMGAEDERLSRQGVCHVWFTVLLQLE